MNQHFDRSGKGESEEFEDRLASLSLAPHSEDYQQLAKKLQSSRPAVAGRRWLWLAVPAALSVLVFAALPWLGSEQPVAPVTTPVAELNETDNPDQEEAYESVFASLRPDYLAGIHYTELARPVAIADSDTIQVNVFFWYPCNPCDQFEPLLQQWAESLPDNVTLVRVPTVWAPQMRFHARVYYTAQALGVLDQTHRELFQAFQGDMPAITNAAELQEFFAGYGVSAARFDAVFNSPGIDNLVESAVQRSIEFDVQATPTLYVQGRYRVNSSAAGHEEMLQVTEYLIDLVQQAR